MVVCDRFLAVLAPHERGDVGYWPWTIQGVHGHEIIKAFWLERHKPTCHPVRLELENMPSIALCKDLYRFRLVIRDLVEIDNPSFPLLDQDHTTLVDCQSLQPKGVKLYNPYGFDITSVILRDEIGLANHARNRPTRHYRQCLGKRLSRDDDPAGVDAGLPDASFKFLSYAKNLLLQWCALFVCIPQFFRS